MGHECSNFVRSHSFIREKFVDGSSRDLLLPRLVSGEVGVEQIEFAL
jgi:hypothetical protein